MFTLHRRMCTKEQPHAEPYAVPIDCGTPIAEMVNVGSKQNQTFLRGETMKGLSAITVALAVTVTSSAFAATSSTKATAKKADGAATTTAVAMPSNSSPAAQAASTGSGTITAPVPAAAAKKWSMDLYAESYYDVDKAEHGQGQMDTAEFVGVNYKLKDNLKTYIRQNFSAQLDTGAKDGAQAGTFARIDDTELGLGLSKIATWGNEGSLSITNRLYLPTGRNSIAAGKIVQLREVIIASQPVNKHLELGAVLDPRLYVYTKDSYINDMGKEKKTKDAASYQYGYVTGKANDDLSATAALGTYNALQHHGHSTGAITYLDISASAQVTKALALTLGLENDADISSAAKRSHAFLRRDETQYYMNMMASM